MQILFEKVNKIFCKISEIVVFFRKLCYNISKSDGVPQKIIIKE